MGLKLLVLDDQEEVVDLLRLLLEPLFPEGVMTFTDPVLAAACIATNRIHGALLDVEMPDLDGFAVIEQIRASVLNSRVPIAMITGEEPTPTRERAFGLGATAMLSKPFTFEQAVALGAVLKGLMHQEAVRGLRLPLRLEMAVSLGGTPLTQCRTLNLGDAGALVQLDSPIRPGTPLELEFPLPGETAPLRLGARVAGAVGGGQHRLVFESYAGDARERLRAYLADQLAT
jgi:CheY-like chemotaxis protein